MPRPTTSAFPRERQALAAIGARVELARRRRRISATEMAARVGVSRLTLRRLEKGDPSVGLSVLVRALTVLGLAHDLDNVAANDEIGRRLVDNALPKRPRRAS